MYNMTKIFSSTTRWTPPSPRWRHPRVCLTCLWDTWNNLKYIFLQKLGQIDVRHDKTIFSSPTWWAPNSPRCQRPWGCPTRPQGTLNHLKLISHQKLGRNDVQHDRKIWNCLRFQHWFYFWAEMIISSWNLFRFFLQEFISKIVLKMVYFYNKSSKITNYIFPRNSTCINGKLRSIANFYKKTKTFLAYSKNSNSEKYNSVLIIF